MTTKNKTPYTKVGDVLTFKFRVPGFSQAQIDALVFELLVQLEASDDHPTAFIEHPAHLERVWLEVGYGLHNLTANDVASWELVGHCARGHEMRRDPINHDHAVDLGCDAELALRAP